ncbi:hypothetical protein IFT59_18845 [Rhizobium sp. CFBP 8752]|uniref:hypothetical protein n=1 Tax=Rhizobium sp. CFBP 8752 TaxID=2775301 RepID=UPI00177EB2C8|nr:hypothetical protein [Rhizobium sp. CFBP 8752]MBD8665302.1 hypothetical protein [Rhizobium sp. CFBP 8752]
MSTVRISPEVELQELRAMNAHLQNRNLVLAQGVAEAREIIAEQQARIAEMESSAATVDEPEAN